ncbi:MAG: KH domain-containing protein [Clostridiales bacterium]|nr:KH domain-containing protein [Clostridiales bacterium]MCF8022608.1 KH domain-containing protein [Clostridiales bacterium]
MKELVEILAKALVNQPEQVTVDMIEKEKASVIQLRVAPEDMGKVIGKHGKIAKAVRSVVKAAATRERRKVVVEIDSITTSR